MGSHLFLIANFTSRNPAWDVEFVCVCVCVDGRGCMYCTCFSFGTWCHRCVARYQCVTALELTDESTEPDPGIASGCKPLTLTLLLGDVLYTLCSFVSPLQLCNIMQPRHCLLFSICRLFRSCFLLSCRTSCVSTSGFCTECSLVLFFKHVLLNPYCSKSNEKCTESQ